MILAEDILFDSDVLYLLRLCLKSVKRAELLEREGRGEVKGSGLLNVFTDVLGSERLKENIIIGDKAFILDNKDINIIMRQFSVI